MPIFLYGIFFEENGDQCGGGDGHERSCDSSECGSEEKRDEHCQAHEVDAGAHDAGDEVDVLDVEVDHVEDEDAEHLGPGVEGGDSGSKRDGDDASRDRDDVEESHKKAEQEEIANVQESEDDGAGDSEDEHQEALADEPLADLLVGALEGVVEPNAAREREERKKEMIGMLAFEHEIEAKERGGEDVEEVREPQRERGEEIGCAGSEGFFAASRNGLNIQPIDEGKVVDFFDETGETMGELIGELSEIVKDRGQSEKEEEGKDESHP